jgi:predicted HicB family RNase H-like nuclease
VIEMPKKKPATRTTVRLPDDIHHRAKKAAVDLHMPLQDFVAEAIELKLKALETPKPRMVPPKGGRGA